MSIFDDDSAMSAAAGDVRPSAGLDAALGDLNHIPSSHAGLVAHSRALEETYHTVMADMVASAGGDTDAAMQMFTVNQTKVHRIMALWKVTKIKLAASAAKGPYRELVSDGEFPELADADLDEERGYGPKGTVAPSAVRAPSDAFVDSTGSVGVPPFGALPEPREV